MRKLRRRMVLWILALCVALYVGIHGYGPRLLQKQTAMAVSSRPPLVESSDPASLFKTVGLVRDRDFEDMPEGVRALAESYMQSVQDGSHPKFLTGGFDDANALAAYETFGFVPTFHAEAYVKTSSGWRFAKGWDDIGQVNSLQGLLLAIHPESPKSPDPR